MLRRVYTYRFWLYCRCYNWLWWIILLWLYFRFNRWFGWLLAFRLCFRGSHIRPWGLFEYRHSFRNELFRFLAFRLTHRSYSFGQIFAFRLITTSNFRLREIFLYTRLSNHFKLRTFLLLFNRLVLYWLQIAIIRCEIRHFIDKATNLCLLMEETTVSLHQSTPTTTLTLLVLYHYILLCLSLDYWLLQRLLLWLLLRLVLRLFQRFFLRLPQRLLLRLPQWFLWLLVLHFLRWLLRHFLLWLFDRFLRHFIQ